ncbi:arylsulfatase I isoform X1 [Gasterosteus aculeatus]
MVETKRPPQRGCAPPPPDVLHISAVVLRSAAGPSPQLRLPGVVAEEVVTLLLLLLLFFSPEVEMQAAAAALAVLSVVLGLDGLRAHRSEPNQNHTEPKKKKTQPHIIFILTDDQGFNDIGYHNPTLKTPTLDKLAAEGVTLENYYVQPICTPSRSQLITGRYQIHTGLQHSIIRPSQPSCLPAHMDTLPERLRQAGYATHMVGKWHLGFYRKACLPTRKGFDSFFGSLTGSVDYYSYGSCDGPGLCGYDLHDDEGVAWGQEGKYSTTLFTQRARKILESHDPADRPLFLLLSLQAVHTPLQTPKSYIYPYRDMANVARRKFAAMVSTVDEAVRNVTYALRKHGYYRNSVIIYSTDNGAQPFTGGSNWPLRGRKSRGLDGFDVWPTISEGRESPRQEILHNIDPLHKPPAQTTKWGAASGPKKPKKKKIQKKRIHKLKPKQKSAFRLKRLHQAQNQSPRPKSYSSGAPPAAGTSHSRSQIQSRPGSKSRRNASRNQDPPASASKAQLGPHSGPRNGSRPTAGWPQPPWDPSVQAAIRVGDWKLLTGDPGHGDWVPPQVLPTLPGRWWNLERSLSPPPEEPPLQNVWLFNITADPCERRDLSGQRPDVVRRLMARLAHYNQSAVPVYFPPDDPRADPARHAGAWVPWVEEEVEEREEGRYHGVYKKGRGGKKKRKNPRCPLCKLRSFFLKLNTGMMSNRI